MPQPYGGSAESEFHSGSDHAGNAREQSKRRSQLGCTLPRDRAPIAFGGNGSGGHPQLAVTQRTRSKHQTTRTTRTRWLLALTPESAGEILDSATSNGHSRSHWTSAAALPINFWLPPSLQEPSFSSWTCVHCATKFIYNQYKLKRSLKRTGIYPPRESIA